MQVDPRREALIEQWNNLQRLKEKFQFSLMEAEEDFARLQMKIQDRQSKIRELDIQMQQIAAQINR